MENNLTMNEEKEKKIMNNKNIIDYEKKWIRILENENKLLKKQQIKYRNIVNNDKTEINRLREEINKLIDENVYLVDKIKLISKP